MAKIHIDLGLPERRTRDKAIFELLNAIYKTLEKFSSELEYYELKEIEITEDKALNHIDFILSGHNKKTSEYLEIKIIVWYYEDDEDDEDDEN